MAYFTGKNAAIVIGGVPYCLTDWSLNLTSDEVDLTTFCSGGVNTVVGGILGGDMSASGPYTGSAPTVGQVYNVIFYLAAPGGPSFQQYFLITSVRVATNVRDKATIEVSGTLTALATL